MWEELAFISLFTGDDLGEKTFGKRGHCKAQKRSVFYPSLGSGTDELTEPESVWKSVPRTGKHLDFSTNWDSFHSFFLFYPLFHFFFLSFPPPSLLRSLAFQLQHSHVVQAGLELRFPTAGVTCMHHHLPDSKLESDSCSSVIQSQPYRAMHLEASD